MHRPIHLHTKKDGSVLGVDVPDPQDPSKHWHPDSDGPSSTDAYGEGHTHEDYHGAISGGPINLSTEQAEALAKDLLNGSSE